MISKRGTREALLEEVALLLSVLLGDKMLDGGSVAGLARVYLVPVGGGERTGSYAGCFRDVLYDCTDIASHVMVRAARLMT